MLARIGHAFGWVGNALAVILLGLGIASTRGEDPIAPAIFIGASVAAFLVGHAIRYIFGGIILERAMRKRGFTDPWP